MTTLSFKPYHKTPAIVDFMKLATCLIYSIFIASFTYCMFFENVLHDKSKLVLSVESGPFILGMGIALGLAFHILTDNQQGQAFIAKALQIKLVLNASATVIALAVSTGFAEITIEVMGFINHQQVVVGFAQFITVGSGAVLLYRIMFSYLKNRFKSMDSK